ncbi:MAG: hypothetical protein KGZ79_00395 [Dethiobacter sp.]|nr:hypothetical protein [Dethiobacter sp.]
MITIEGILERVNSYPSGTYLALKDPQSPEVSLTCLLPPSHKVDFELKQGLTIQATGTVEMRPKKNNADHETVIFVNQLFEINKGEITEMEAFRQQLRDRGFLENKKAMPEIAGKEELKICVISSVDGVAYRDIEHIVKPFPFFKMELYPTNLFSPEDVANSIIKADRRDNDLLVVSRGGGSRLEVFNQLPVLAAINGAKKPVLVAVGHAQDITLADEVADIHAPTPTAAGELLVQHYRANELAKKAKEMEKKEQQLEKILNRMTTAHAEEKNKLLKQMDEQSSLIKIMRSSVSEKELYEKELKALKRRLQSAEANRPRLVITPGFVVFGLTVLAAIYFITTR